MKDLPPTGFWEIIAIGTFIVVTTFIAIICYKSELAILTSELIKDYMVKQEHLMANLRWLKLYHNTLDPKESKQLADELIYKTNDLIDYYKICMERKLETKELISIFKPLKDTKKLLTQDKIDITMLHLQEIKLKLQVPKPNTSLEPEILAQNKKNSNFLETLTLSDIVYGSITGVLGITLICGIYWFFIKKPINSEIPTEKPINSEIPTEKPINSEIPTEKPIKNKH